MLGQGLPGTTQPQHGGCAGPGHGAGSCCSPDDSRARTALPTSSIQSARNTGHRSAAPSRGCAGSRLLLARPFMLAREGTHVEFGVLVAETCEEQAARRRAGTSIAKTGLASPRGVGVRDEAPGPLAQAFGAMATCRGRLRICSFKKAVAGRRRRLRAQGRVPTMEQLSPIPSSPSKGMVPDTVDGSLERSADTVSRRKSVLIPVEGGVASQGLDVLRCWRRLWHSRSSDPIQRGGPG